MVALDCSVQTIRDGRFQQCPLLHPRLLPVEPGQPLVIEIPDLTRVHSQKSRWTDDDRTTIRLSGYVFIALFLLLAWWIRRRPSTAQPSIETTEPSGWTRWLGWLFSLLALAIYSIGLNAETLGLLEYTYFQEGVRPETAFDVVRDSISTELAHGPIAPLILRWVNQMSNAEWALRLPSAIFGACFVGLLVGMTRRAVGHRVAIVAGILALINPLIVYYSQDATPYALAALCAACSVWLLFQATEKPNVWFHWVALCVCQWVGFFAHYGYAFVAFAILLACILAWLKRKPVPLSNAMVAFALAAIPVVWIVPHLLDVLNISGVRFALMSPIYPEDPGLGIYLSQFLTVVGGFEGGWQWMLVLVLPLWGLGVQQLWKKARFLAWICIIQLVILTSFVMFNHAMYTSHGGGRVFYAFRYATPFVLCMTLPLAASIMSRLPWTAWALVVISAFSSATLWTQPTRSSQDEAAQTIAQQIQDGDAYAVLPASFYGDPFQYYLLNKEASSLITRGRATTLSIRQTNLWGPLMETHTPLPTQAAHMGHKRLWVASYKEEMLGIAKFDPAIIESNLEQIAKECGPASQTLELSLMSVHRFDCSSSRVWAGADTVHLDASNSFQLDRWLVRPQHARSLSSGQPFQIHIPEGCRTVRVRASKSAMNSEAMQVSANNQTEKSSFQRVDDNHGLWTLNLTETENSPTLSIVPNKTDAPRIEQVVFQR